ncbi:SDR family NAD(P)-dependent oxidoreductase [Nocardioides deserti]|uniref:SDR family oxidoreductase n=1 Tax=Nocardioides deserti TaxID=1588644 RepID=A0ABR6U6Z8_9ACTN|nr:SDR family oxidoreductase [Nocardioides deserti]MBC2960085.1 SDR family oxidoreductase [Nocardioides deserti]GGO74975.1 3-oxoacyl-ACP reductase [Nocardioides deserti]
MSTVLVTGGARGIGAAIAARHTGVGDTVLVTDVDDDGGKRLVEELRSAGAGAAHYVRCDVTSEDDVRAAVAHAEQHLGPLDVVYANAGVVGVTGCLETHSLEDWRRTMDLLLTSVFLTVRESVAVMRPRGCGAIVCTASVAGVRGGLGPHAYTAAKHGVVGLVESVAVEVARYGLRINAVAPGGVVSSLSASLMTGEEDDLQVAYDRLAAASASGMPTTSADVADAAVFLGGPGSSRINGTTLVVDGADYVPSQKGLSYYR